MLSILANCFTQLPNLAVHGGNISVVLNSMCYLENVLTCNENHPVFKSLAMSCCVERIAVMTKTMCVTSQQPAHQ